MLAIVESPARQSRGFVFHALRAILPGLILLAAAPAGAAIQAKQSPMNVLLILADDLGWSDLGCQGGDLHETPRIDRLAAEGIRFTQAYAASVCSPTRSSLMTGKHPARLGITIWLEAARTPPPARNRKLIPPEAVADLPRLLFHPDEIARFLADAK